jgi:peptide/nickel transport system permease protein
MPWRTRAFASRSRSLASGAVLVAAVALAALLAPVLAPFEPDTVPDRPEAVSLRAPGAPFHLGTDLRGRDVLSRLLYGARVALLVGVGTQLAAALVGVLVGLAAGYCGGLVDQLLMRLTDVVRAVPPLVLAIGLVAVFWTPGLDKVVVVLVLVGWTTIARLVRAEVAALAEHEFVRAARALGVREPAILRRHLLPNLAGPVLVTGTVGVAGNIAAEAALSFLGLGAQPPTISWGAMLAEGQAFLTTSPWVVFFPGLALTLTVLGVNLLGDGLRDVLEPGDARAH